MTNSNKKQLWCIGLIVLMVATISFAYWGGRKEVWFCDEIYTYESANGFEQEWPSANVGQWMSGDDIEDFMAADDEQLAFNEITVRLYGDHVPLYFWLFRAVSFFFFKGSSSIWIGLSINLFFYLITLGIGYCLLAKLTGSPVVSAVIVVLAGIVNRLMLEQATILRMYMMLLCMEILLLLGGLWMICKAEKGKLSAGPFIYLFGVSLVGFLIHYDYWIFYAFTATFFCLWLLISAFGKWKKHFWNSLEFKYVLAWVGNFGASLLTTIFIFPYCRWNLNRGKGQTALHSILVFSKEKLELLKWGYVRLAASIWGEKVPTILGLAILFGCIIGGIIVLYKRKEKLKTVGVILVVLIAQAYQLTVCFTMPGGAEERYLWGPFTLMLVCALYGGWLLLDTLFVRIADAGMRKKLCRGIYTVLTILLLTGQLLVIDGGHGVACLFHPYRDMALLKERSHIPWVVYGTTGTNEEVYSYYDWLLPERICFLTADNTAEDATAVAWLSDKEQFVLYCRENQLHEAVDFLERELGKELTKEYLALSTNLSVYEMNVVK